MYTHIFFTLGTLPKWQFNQILHTAESMSVSSLALWFIRENLYQASALMSCLQRRRIKPTSFFCEIYLRPVLPVMKSSECRMHSRFTLSNQKSAKKPIFFCNSLDKLCCCMYLFVFELWIDLLVVGFLKCECLYPFYPAFCRVTFHLLSCYLQNSGSYSLGTLASQRGHESITDYKPIVTIRWQEKVGTRHRHRASADSWLLILLLLDDKHRSTTVRPGEK